MRDSTLYNYRFLSRDRMYLLNRDSNIDRRHTLETKHRRLASSYGRRQFSNITLHTANIFHSTQFSFTHSVMADKKMQPRSSSTSNTGLIRETNKNPTLRA